MKEEWKIIKDFINYEVSNLGRIRKKFGICRWQKDYCLVLRPNIKGYLKATLEINKKRHTKFVHRFVLEAFKPEHPIEKSQCNHIDGNRLNNCIENLEWVTPQENTKHAIRLGLRGTNSMFQKGEKHHRSYLTEEKVRRMKKLASNGVRKHLIAKHFGISQSHLGNILSGILWGHVK